jgi:hypothetical protein
VQSLGFSTGRLDVEAITGTDSALVDVKCDVLGLPCASYDVVFSPDPFQSGTDVGALVVLPGQRSRCVVDAFNAHEHPLCLEDLALGAATAKEVGHPRRCPEDSGDAAQKGDPRGPWGEGVGLPSGDRHPGFCHVRT